MRVCTFVCVGVVSLFLCVCMCISVSDCVYVCGACVPMCVYVCVCVYVCGACVPMCVCLCVCMRVCRIPALSLLHHSRLCRDRLLWRPDLVPSCPDLRPDPLESSHWLLLL